MPDIFKGIVLAIFMSAEFSEMEWVLLDWLVIIKSAVLQNLAFKARPKSQHRVELESSILQTCKQTQFTDNKNKSKDVFSY